MTEVSWERVVPPVPENPDVVIIGSGLSGLTAAAYLAANGKKVLVLEQYDVAGGCSQTFRRKNEWQFDVGLHYIGGVRTGEIGRIIGGLGLNDRIEFPELDPDGFDTFVFPDLEFKVPKGWDNYVGRLVETFPDEEEGLRAVTDVMRNMMEELREVGIPDSDTDLKEYVEKAPTVVSWGMRSMTDLFDEHYLSERSRAVLLGQAGDYATPPSRTPVTLHSGVVDHYLHEGAFYVRGGGQEMAGHLVDLIHTYGGRVRTHAEVERILTEETGSGGYRVTGVELAGGEEIATESVIATGDIKHLFLELLDPEAVPEDIRNTVDGYRMATPLVTVYLGLDFDITDRMPATNYWLHSRYDQESYYEPVAAGEFDTDPPVYISSASAKDPGHEGHAPPGCSTLELMTWATPDPAAWGVDESEEAPKYSRQDGYREAKQKITDQLIDRAEEQLGELRSHILWEEAASPMTQTRYTLSSGGSSYGIELATDQFGPLRLEYRTPIEGLTLGGVSSRRGHGILGAMAGGVESASTVLGRSLRTEINEGTVFGDPSQLTSGAEGWDALEACRKLQEKALRA
ncbi:MAG: NAD(P)/FAD-dependent oxidoreductase [Solirubrobacterales bacterium]|nr:NAD(P)/FAD-dependent oxidoreductase [Solirubrobacterales bacterium]MCB0862298.1 NAD(P)/FAD-dependent oxidoreductase [Solirubrobacterales bacterium]